MLYLLRYVNLELWSEHDFKIVWEWLTDEKFGILFTFLTEMRIDIEAHEWHVWEHVLPVNLITQDNPSNVVSLSHHFADHQQGKDHMKQPLQLLPGFHS